MKYYSDTKNKLRFISVPFLLFLILLSGCSSVQVGRDFDVQLFSSMVKAGETNKTQVHGWLGAPSSTGVSLDKDGELSEEWLYFHGGGTLPKMQDTKIKILQIRFSKKGVIKSYNWSNSK
ncbi:MAG: hypothetical protein OQK75_02705 [Gammaproteobacteria bacterium]|nr:hypothetical protein [Gammaproteobacteria bacterium]MCW8986558.1 hypothetical protein [Gammaproteobacteria bacterium]MCW9031919.1 hypothetical protein [Gammaproteobacteria bacterium]